MIKAQGQYGTLVPDEKIFLPKEIYLLIGLKIKQKSIVFR